MGHLHFLRSQRAIRGDLCLSGIRISPNLDLPASDTRRTRESAFGRRV